MFHQTFFISYLCYLSSGGGWGNWVPLLGAEEAAYTSRVTNDSKNLSLHGKELVWGAPTLRLCSFTQLHRNTAGTQNVGRSFPGFLWEFLLLPDLALKENAHFGAASKHCTSKTPVSGKNIPKMWDLWALRDHTRGKHTNVTASQKRPSIIHLTSHTLFHT